MRHIDNEMLPKKFLLNKNLTQDYIHIIYFLKPMYKIYNNFQAASRLLVYLREQDYARS